MLEVRNELHFHDLAVGSAPSLRVRDRLQKTLPTRCTGIAQLWARTCRTPGFPDAFRELRYVSHDPSRAQHMDELRQRTRDDLREQGGW